MIAKHPIQRKIVAVFCFVLLLWLPACNRARTQEAAKPSQLAPTSASAAALSPVTGARKVALVIGNVDYKEIGAVPPAANDADDIGAILKRAGFEVVLCKNLDIKAMSETIDQFVRTVREGDLAFFFYSGHGLQYREENYMLPVDYLPATNRDQIERRGYKMSAVRDQLEERRAQVRVLMFDACRTIPANVLDGKGDGVGLSPMRSGRPEGTLVAFGSAHNQVSRFVPGERNSVYTGAVLRTVAARPDRDLKSLLEDVQILVFSESNHEQVPYLYGFLSNVVYLGSPLASPDNETRRRRSEDEAESEIREAQRLGKLGRQGEAKMHWQNAAEAGNLKAMVELGYLYEHGQTGDKREDLNEAMRWYQRAADKGSNKAMGNLGWVFEHGTPPNYSEALRWYSRAVAAGNQTVVHRLSFLKRRLAISPRDPVPAPANASLHQPRPAAAAPESARLQPAPNPRRQVRSPERPSDSHTGTATPRVTAEESQSEYQAGKTLHDKQLYKEAVPHLEKAATANHTGALNLLGMMYERGLGVPPFRDKARELYMKSAVSGDDKGMTNLGFLYAHDSPPNIEEARRWYGEAAAKGNRAAQTWCKRNGCESRTFK
jgi:TPR repeat protein